MLSLLFPRQGYLPFSALGYVGDCVSDSDEQAVLSDHTLDAHASDGQKTGDGDSTTTLGVAPSISPVHGRLSFCGPHSRAISSDSTKTRVPSSPASQVGSIGEEYLFPDLVDDDTSSAPCPNTSSALDEDSAERRKLSRHIFVLLLHVTSATCVSIADRLIEMVNRSNDEDGWLLRTVARHIRRTASKQAHMAELLARLCRRMVEQLSPDVQLRGGLEELPVVPDRNPLAGGRHFRLCVIHDCNFAFDIRLIALGLAPIEGNDSDSDSDSEEAGLLREAYRRAAEELKVQGTGLVKFIAELFKMRLLPARVMHQCVRGLLRGDPASPNVKAVEDACVLLTSVGQSLDTREAQPSVDAYFARLESMSRAPRCTWPMYSMLKRIIELRAGGWSAPVPATTGNLIGTLAWGAGYCQWPHSKNGVDDVSTTENWRTHKGQPNSEGHSPFEAANRSGGSGRIWANSRLRRTKNTA